MKKVINILSVVVCLIVLGNINIHAQESDVFLNPEDKADGLILSNENLTVENPYEAYNCIRATKPIKSGKSYFEVTIDKGDSFLYASMIGITNKSEALKHGQSCSSLRNARVYRGNGTIWTPEKSYSQAFVVGDVIGVAVDMDNGTIEFYKNGESLGVAYDNLLLLNEVYPFLIVYKDVKMTANFGKTDFKYPIPNEFKPLDNSVDSDKKDIEILSNKDKVKVGEVFTTDVVINNQSDIYAEDFSITYEKNLFEYIGHEEVDGLKVIKSIEKDGLLRFIIASKGKTNVITGTNILVKLKFKAKNTGEGLVDSTNARISNIQKEWDIKNNECGEKKIVVEGISDINRTGEFTLLDLAIDAFYYSELVENTDTNKYDTDVVANGTIDDGDLILIVTEMLNNNNYSPNN